MQNVQAKSPLETIKNKIIEQIILITIILFLPVLASSLLRTFTTGWGMIYNLELLFSICFIILFIFRKKLNQQTKTLFLIILMFFVAANGLYNFGFLASGKLHLISAIIMGGLLINKRAGFILLSCAIIILSAFAYLFTKGILTYNFGIEHYLNIPITWILNGFILVGVVLIIMIIVYQIEKEILKLLRIKTEQEENYRSLFEQAADGIIISNTRGDILMANRSFSEILCYDSKQIEGKNIVDFFDSKELEEKPLRFDLLTKGKSVLTERRALSSNGLSIDIETRASMLRDGRIQTIIRDISNRKQLEKELYKASINAEEKERERLAKDLHDGLGPLLSTCRIYIHEIKTFEDKTEAVENLEELIAEALASIREISNNISPHALRNFGILHALNNFTGKLGNKININIDSSISPKRRFEDIVETTLYRVIIELLTNTLKHAKANRVDIRFKESGKKLLIEYNDNGIGFDREKAVKKNTGLGLMNIQSRINSIGGKMNYYSTPGDGVKINIELKTN